MSTRLVGSFRRRAGDTDGGCRRVTSHGIGFDPETVAAGGIERAAEGDRIVVGRSSANLGPGAAHLLFDAEAGGLSRNCSATRAVTSSGVIDVTCKLLGAIGSVYADWVSEGTELPVVVDWR